jgi:hypothetical protein
MIDRDKMQERTVIVLKCYTDIAVHQNHYAHLTSFGCDYKEISPFKALLNVVINIYD